LRAPGKSRWDGNGRIGNKRGKQEIREGRGREGEKSLKRREREKNIASSLNSACYITVRY